MITVVLRALALAALAVALVPAFAGMTGPALAHAVLVSSDPVDGAVLARAPALATLVFNEPVEPVHMRVVERRSGALVATLAPPSGRGRARHGDASRPGGRRLAPQLARDLRRFAPRRRQHRLRRGGGGPDREPSARGPRRGRPDPARRGGAGDRARPAPRRGRRRPRPRRVRAAPRRAGDAIGAPRGRPPGERVRARRPRLRPDPERGGGRRGGRRAAARRVARDPARACRARGRRPVGRARAPAAPRGDRRAPDASRSRSWAQRRSPPSPRQVTPRKRRRAPSRRSSSQPTASPRESGSAASSCWSRPPAPRATPISHGSSAPSPGAPCPRWRSSSRRAWASPLCRPATRRRSRARPGAGCCSSRSRSWRSPSPSPHRTGGGSPAQSRVPNPKRGDRLTRNVALEIALLAGVLGLTGRARAGPATPRARRGPRRDAGARRSDGPRPSPPHGDADAGAAPPTDRLALTVSLTDPAGRPVPLREAVLQASLPEAGIEAGHAADAGGGRRRAPGDGGTSPLPASGGSTWGSSSTISTPPEWGSTCRARDGAIRRRHVKSGG